MSLIFQIIAVLINLIFMLKILRGLKYNLRAINIVLLIFQMVYVFPVVVEWIFGVQDYSGRFPRFDLALNDVKTNIIYSLFVIVVPTVLYFSGKKNTKNRIDIRNLHFTMNNMKVRKVFYMISVFLMFTPVLLILFAPSPEKYLTQYAFFERYTNLATESELFYHRNVMKIGGFISLLAIAFTKLVSKNKLFTNLIIYFAAIATGLLDGKRTIFAFIIFAILAVEILKSPKGKFPIKKIVFSAIFIISFFIGYAFIIDKLPVSINTIDNLRLYFFRDVDVKFSIYSLLNPMEYRVLDYWGQSYLFNILFFVPRSLWPNKPYPYDIYVTSGALGYEPGTLVGWNLQTSIFGEGLANLGWLGIPFVLFIIIKFIRISERSKSPIIIALSLFIVMYSFMNHFGSFARFFLIWLVLILNNKVKIRF